MVIFQQQTYMGDLHGFTVANGATMVVRNGIQRCFFCQFLMILVHVTLW